MNQDTNQKEQVQKTDVDKAWDDTFNSIESQDFLEELANKIIADVESGNVTPLHEEK